MELGDDLDGHVADADRRQSSREAFLPQVDAGALLLAQPRTQLRRSHQMVRVGQLRKKEERPGIVEQM